MFVCVCAFWALEAPRAPLASYKNTIRLEKYSCSIENCNVLRNSVLFQEMCFFIRKSVFVLLSLISIYGPRVICDM